MSMDTHCNVCGRETNSAGNCPVTHYITDAEFAAYMQKHGHQIDALRKFGDWDHPTEKEWTAAMQLAQAECARLRARCARLEGALDECIKAIKEWPQIHPEGDYLHGWVLTQAIEAREVMP